MGTGLLSLDLVDGGSSGGGDLDTGLQGLAGEGRLGMRLGGLLRESSHLFDALTDGDLEITPGDRSGRADSIEHLLLHLGASALGLQGKSLHRGIGLGTQLGDLSVELVVKEPAGVLVHLGATLLDELGTLLTLLNSLTDGVVELVLVGILEGSNLLTTASGLGSVSLHDTRELLNLLGGLLLALHLLLLPESAPNSTGGFL